MSRSFRIAGLAVIVAVIAFTAVGKLPSKSYDSSPYDLAKVTDDAWNNSGFSPEAIGLLRGCAGNDATIRAVSPHTPLTDAMVRQMRPCVSAFVTFSIRGDELMAEKGGSGDLSTVDLVLRERKPIPVDPSVIDVIYSAKIKDGYTGLVSYIRTSDRYSGGMRPWSWAPLDGILCKSDNDCDIAVAVYDLREPSFKREAAAPPGLDWASVMGTRMFARQR